jgi:hypothetical protein
MMRALVFSLSPQDIIRTMRMLRPVISVINFDVPRHDLTRRPQVPAELTTLLRAVRLPEDGDAGVSNVLFNYLLDSESAERKILVQVCG